MSEPLQPNSSRHPLPISQPRDAASGYTLGVDLGTTFSAAAGCRAGRAEVISLGSHGAAVPSVVLLRADGTLLSGEAAERRAVLEPHRVAREFKRRLGDSTPILLGGSPYSAEALMATLLRSIVDQVVARQGEPPVALCLTHPATWGAFKLDLVRQAVALAGLDGDPARPVRLIAEPVAAAAHHSRDQRIPPGALVAVYDLGGGTFDAAVLRATDLDFEILGQPEGVERLGGIDFDAAVFHHVISVLGPAATELDDDDPAVRAALARLREECVAAKEALSSDTDVAIPVVLPGLTTEVRLTRGELEVMITPALESSVQALRRAIGSAGLEPQDLHAVLLVGGSSRIPLVAQLVGELGCPVSVQAHPKFAIAQGAAHLAQPAPAPATRATGLPLLPLVTSATSATGSPSTATGSPGATGSATPPVLDPGPTAPVFDWSPAARAGAPDLGRRRLVRAIVGGVILAGGLAGLSVAYATLQDDAARAPGVGSFSSTSPTTARVASGRPATTRTGRTGAQPGAVPNGGGNPGGAEGGAIGEVEPTTAPPRTTPAVTPTGAPSPGTTTGTTTTTGAPSASVPSPSRTRTRTPTRTRTRTPTVTRTRTRTPTPVSTPVSIPLATRQPAVVSR